MNTRSRNTTRLATRVALRILLLAAMFVPDLSAAENPVGPVPPNQSTGRTAEFGASTAKQSPTACILAAASRSFQTQTRRQTAFGRSVAFLAGVSKYYHQSPQLPFVDSDLTELRNFLLTDGGFDTVYEARVIL